MKTYSAVSAAQHPSPFLDSDGCQLYFKEWGEGEPILFVHSWSVNSELWQYQMVDLASSGFRCIAYDQRGHGKSSDPGRGYDYDTLGDDLAVVMGHLNLAGVTLVGHSMGCGVIARYLARHGKDRTARAVFIAPTLPFMLKTTDNPDGIDRIVFDQMRKAWSEDFPKWLDENAAGFFAYAASPGMMRLGIRMCLQSSLGAAIECNRTLSETDFRKELPYLNVPTLILHGDKDLGNPLELTSKRVARLIPESKLIVYEGGPHGLMLTHSAQLNADLRSFIKNERPFQGAAYSELDAQSANQ